MEIFNLIIATFFTAVLIWVTQDNIKSIRQSWAWGDRIQPILVAVTNIIVLIAYVFILISWFSSF